MQVPSELTVFCDLNYHLHVFRGSGSHHLHNDKLEMDGASGPFQRDSPSGLSSPWERRRPQRAGESLISLGGARTLCMGLLHCIKLIRCYYDRLSLLLMNQVLAQCNRTRTIVPPSARMSPLSFPGWLPVCDWWSCLWKGWAREPSQGLWSSDT